MFGADTERMQQLARATGVAARWAGLRAAFRTSRSEECPLHEDDGGSAAGGGSPRSSGATGSRADTSSTAAPTGVRPATRAAGTAGSGARSIVATGEAKSRAGVGERCALRWTAPAGCRRPCGCGSPRRPSGSPRRAGWPARRASCGGWCPRLGCPTEERRQTLLSRASRRAGCGTEVDRQPLPTWQGLTVHLCGGLSIGDNGTRFERRCP